LFFIGGYPPVTRAEAMISTDMVSREYFNIDGRIEWLKRYAGLYLRTPESGNWRGAGGYDDHHWKKHILVGIHSLAIHTPDMESSRAITLSKDKGVIVTRNSIWPGCVCNSTSSRGGRVVRESNVHTSSIGWVGGWGVLPMIDTE
jgi:hypothetical protein